MSGYPMGYTALKHLSVSQVNCNLQHRSAVTLIALIHMPFLFIFLLYRFVLLLLLFCDVKDLAFARVLGIESYFRHMVRGNVSRHVLTVQQAHVKHVIPVLQFPGFTNRWPNFSG